MICLDSVDLHIQIPRLGTKWIHPLRTKSTSVSRPTSSSSSSAVPFLLAHRISFSYVSICVDFVYILLDLVVKQNTCKVYQFITCITLYLYSIVGIYEYITLVLYSVSGLYCTFSLSVYMWGQFWPTYIRRGDVSVSARIGALQVGIRAQALKPKVQSSGKS